MRAGGRGFKCRGAGQNGQVAEWYGELPECARVKCLSHSLGELVAGKATVDEVALELVDRALSVGVTHAQFGPRPEASRDVHPLRRYIAGSTACQEIAARNAAWRVWVTLRRWSPSG